MNSRQILVRYVKYGRIKAAREVRLTLSLLSTIANK